MQRFPQSSSWPMQASPRQQSCPRLSRSKSQTFRVMQQDPGTFRQIPAHPIASMQNASAHAVAAEAKSPHDSGKTKLSHEPTTDEAWLSAGMVAQRRNVLGLSKASVTAFTDDCEFISLGGYCAVARALECVGLKKLAYPFDWVRSPLEGIIQCVETNFKDFLTYSTVCEQNNMKVYGRSKWGGSFWHHDPDSDEIKSAMSRRIERFFGRADVPTRRTRVFVRAVNCSAELEQCVRLQKVLRKAFRKAEIYLLVLVDFQMDAAPVSVAGNDSFLCLRIHESVGPLPGPASSSWTMQRQAEAYAEAIAFGLRFLAGERCSEENAPYRVRSVPDFRSLSELCEPFEGSDPATEMWLPKKIDKPITTRGSFHNTMDQYVSAKTMAKTLSTPLNISHHQSLGAPVGSAARQSGAIYSLSHTQSAMCPVADTQRREPSSLMGSTPNPTLLTNRNQSSLPFKASSALTHERHAYKSISHFASSGYPTWQPVH